MAIWIRIRDEALADRGFKGRLIHSVAREGDFIAKRAVEGGVLGEDETIESHEMRGLYWTPISILAKEGMHFVTGHRVESKVSGLGSQGQCESFSGERRVSHGRPECVGRVHLLA